MVFLRTESNNRIVADILATSDVRANTFAKITSLIGNRRKYRDRDKYDKWKIIRLAFLGHSSYQFFCSFAFIAYETCGKTGNSVIFRFWCKACFVWRNWTIQYAVEMGRNIVGMYERAERTIVEIVTTTYFALASKNFFCHFSADCCCANGKYLQNHVNLMSQCASKKCTFKCERWIPLWEITKNARNQTIFYCENLLTILREKCLWCGPTPNVKCENRCAQFKCRHFKS